MNLNHYTVAMKNPEIVFSLSFHYSVSRIEPEINQAATNRSNFKCLECAKKVISKCAKQK